MANNGSNGKYSRRDNHTRRGVFTGQWMTEIMATPCASPLFCLQATACAPCTSFQLRKQALRGDMSRYMCCQGAFPCSGRFGERQCPDACLALEVSLCFANSVVTTRWLIQDEMYVMNTGCDNCLMAWLIFIEDVACIFRCAGDLTGSPALEEVGALLTCAADLSYCSICACMQTQHKLQLDARDEGRYIPPTGMYAVPDTQSMSGYPDNSNPYQAAPPAGYPAGGKYQ